MEFFEVIQNRNSIRKYADIAIEEEKIQHVLEAINRAPSAGNLQAFEVYVVRKFELRTALVKAAWDQGFLAEAPVVLVFCANPERAVERYGDRGTSLYCIQDATIACTFAMLAAKALDLDSVWVGAFDEMAVTDILLLPKSLRPVAMLPVGYAGKTPKPRPRRALSDLVHVI